MPEGSSAWLCEFRAVSAVGFSLGCSSEGESTYESRFALEVTL